MLLPPVILQIKQTSLIAFFRTALPNSRRHFQHWAAFCIRKRRRNQLGLFKLICRNRSFHITGHQCIFKKNLITAALWPPHIQICSVSHPHFISEYLKRLKNIKGQKNSAASMASQIIDAAVLLYLHIFKKSPLPISVYQIRNSFPISRSTASARK